MRRWVLFVLTACGTLAGCDGQPSAFERGPVDYAAWQPVLYSLLESNEAGSATWSVSGDAVQQTTNADPSIYLSDRTIEAQAIEGKWRVTGIDDDFIGFVFGYQDPGHMYLFDWKAADQAGAPAGMSIKRIQAEYQGPVAGKLQPGVPDIGIERGGGWCWLGDPDGRIVTEIHRDVTVGGWRTGSEYDFRLEQRSSEYRIVVSAGASIIFDHSFSDPAYPVGRFGFYNYSQAGVTYQGFTVVGIPGRIRWPALALWLLGALGALGALRYLAPILLGQTRERPRRRENPEPCALFETKRGKPIISSHAHAFKPWIKKLICDYLETDFEEDSCRRHYVLQVVQALQRHGSTPGIGVSTTNNFCDIVTEEPCLWTLEKQRVKPQPLRGPRVTRSRLAEGKLVFGIPKNYFATPPSRKEKVQERNLKKAEIALQVIYGGKRIADLLRRKPGSIDGKEAARQVYTAIKEFRRSFLPKGARLHSVEFYTETQKPKLVTWPAETELRESDARNLDVRPFGRDETSLDLMGEGAAAGMTLPIFAVSAPAWWSIWPDLDRLESIERRDRLDPKGFVLGVTTKLVIQVAYGAPEVEERRIRGKRKKKKREIKFARRVFERSGKDPGLDLTDRIREHEEKHVSDTWGSWLEEVVQGVTRGMKDLRFDTAPVAKETRQKVAKVGDEVVIFVFGAFSFGKKVDGGTVKRFRKCAMESLKQVIKHCKAEFKRSYKEKAEVFHDSDEGRPLLHQERIVLPEQEEVGKPKRGALGLP